VTDPLHPSAHLIEGSPVSAAPPPGPQGAGPGDPGQPSQEEVQAYLEQLRGAPVDQVVAEVASALVNAAQVKLGRQDGRLLIDLTAALADTGRDRLDADLTEQLDQATTQLRMAQVEAEQQVASQGGEPGDLGAPDDAGDASDAAAGPDSATPGSESGGDRAGAPSDRGPAGGPATGGSGAGGSGASRLWVPGR
jgi:hypothetical protein